MVFSRLVVSALFLITVVIVPVAVPISPAKPGSSPLRISDSPDAAAASSAGRLAARLADDEVAREAIMDIGAPAADALQAKLGSGPAVERAAAAALLARLAPITWAPKILPVAAAALRTNDERGDAKFGVMTLLSVGAPAAETARVLLGSRDDQAAAAAVIVLARLGALRDEDLALASAPLDRLAFTWPASEDDADVVVEAYAALGGLGEGMLQAMACDARPGAVLRAFELWKAAADPTRESWMPRGRRSVLVKIE